MGEAWDMSLGASAVTELTTEGADDPVDSTEAGGEDDSTEEAEETLPWCRRPLRLPGVEAGEVAADEYEGDKEAPD